MNIDAFKTRIPKKVLMLLFFAVLSIVGVYLYFHIPVAREDALARQNKERVMGLIKVGQDLEDAQEVLRNAGFCLVYDEPIKPTVKEDYLHQLVVVGNPRPNSFETISYITELPMPFRNKESAFVMINATLDGKIFEID